MEIAYLDRSQWTNRYSGRKRRAEGGRKRWQERKIEMRRGQKEIRENPSLHIALTLKLSGDDDYAACTMIDSKRHKVCDAT